MWSKRSSCIATEGNQLATGHWKLICIRVEVAIVFTAVAQLLFYPLFQLRVERIQMAVNCGITFRVSQIKRVSISVWTHRNSAHITFCFRTYHKTIASLGFDVNPSVEVVAA